MQKWKIVLWTLLVLGITSSEVQAADTQPSDSTAAKNNTQSDVLPAPVQDHMIEMMQDDLIPVTPLIISPRKYCACPGKNLFGNFRALNVFTNVVGVGASPRSSESVGSPKPQ